MRKSGLGRADATLVLRHMLSRKLLVSSDGDRVTFEEMVRSQAWRPQLPLEPRPPSDFMLNNNTRAGEQPFAPWPTFGASDRSSGAEPPDEGLESLPVSPKLSVESGWSSGDGLALLSSIASV